MVYRDRQWQLFHSLRFSSAAVGKRKGSTDQMFQQWMKKTDPHYLYVCCLSHVSLHTSQPTLHGRWDEVLLLPGDRGLQRNGDIEKGWSSICKTGVKTPPGLPFVEPDSLCSRTTSGLLSKSAWKRASCKVLWRLIFHGPWPQLLNKWYPGWSIWGHLMVESIGKVHAWWYPSTCGRLWSGGGIS